MEYVNVSALYVVASVTTSTNVCNNLLIDQSFQRLVNIELSEESNFVFVDIRYFMIVFNFNNFLFLIFLFSFIFLGYLAILFVIS